MNIRRSVILLLLAASVAGCAISATEEENYSQNRVLKAWVSVNHPGVKPYGDNQVYILDIDRGSGPAITDSCYIRAHYTTSTLDNSITATNIREKAEQLGQYSITSYYGGNIWRLDQGALPDGLEEVLKTMRAGGHATIALPVAAQSHSQSLYSAFSSTSGSVNQVIDIAVDTVINNIYSWQDDEMIQWFWTHYAVADTASEHLYFKKLIEKTDPADTISQGGNISVRYIGRLMNGQVFDTNIQDTAKFYRIYNPDNAYNALTIAYYRNDDSQLQENNSVVKGFARAVSLMNYGETAVTLFRSDLGYGESGSSPSIPEYSPLVFWLYVEPRD